MDDISKLLQEAKPLYFARKRRNNRIKATCAMLALVVGINFAVTDRGSMYNGYSTETLLSMLETEIAAAEGESAAKDMGLPVDDYGLLMVG